MITATAILTFTDGALGFHNITGRTGERGDLDHTINDMMENDSVSPDETAFYFADLIIDGNGKPRIQGVRGLDIIAWHEQLAAENPDDEVSAIIAHDLRALELRHAAGLMDNYYLDPESTHQGGYYDA